MFEEFFGNCVPEDEESVSHEFSERIQSALLERIHTPEQKQEESIMTKTKTIRTMLLAASVAALGAVTTAGASAVSAVDENTEKKPITTLVAYMDSADGAALGDVVYSVEGGDAVVTGTYTVDLSDAEIKDGETITIQFVDGTLKDSIAANVEYGEIVFPEFSVESTK